MANLRAREFEAILRAHGVEKGMVMITTHLLERINDLEAGQTASAELIARITDIVGNFAQVAENMKAVIEGPEGDARPKQN